MPRRSSISGTSLGINKQIYLSPFGVPLPHDDRKSELDIASDQSSDSQKKGRRHVKTLSLISNKSDTGAFRIDIEDEEDAFEPIPFNVSIAVQNSSPGRKGNLNIGFSPQALKSHVNSSKLSVEAIGFSKAL